MVLVGSRIFHVHLSILFPVVGDVVHVEETHNFLHDIDVVSEIFCVIWLSNWLCRLGLRFIVDLAILAVANQGIMPEVDGNSLSAGGDGVGCTL